MLKRILFVSVLYAYACSSFASMTYSFSCLTNNSSSDCAIAEAEASVEVIDLGAGQVEFRFSVTGSDNFSIAEIYFYDGTLLGLASILDDPSGGVDYLEQTGGSMKLPGTGFGPTKAFAAIDAANPAPSNGVNPGEQVGIVFDLLPGLDYDDVISALALPYSPGAGNGALMIGIHATAFTSGGSESLTTTPVPVPAAAWLFGSGLVGLLWGGRNKRSQCGCA